MDLRLAPLIALLAMAGCAGPMALFSSGAVAVDTLEGNWGHLRAHNGAVLLYREDVPALKPVPRQYECGSRPCKMKTIIGNIGFIRSAIRILTHLGRIFR